MTLRSMTAFAQARGEARATADAAAAEFTLSLKSVNHRFLDLHFRLPSESEGLEMKLRQLLKDKLARGHVDVSLSFEAATSAAALNREFVRSYVEAFRTAALEFGVAGEPDLNAVLRFPGALAGSSAMAQNGNFEAAVLAVAEKALARLNQMREQEGGAIERELRQRMQGLEKAASEIEQLRTAIVRWQKEKIESRLQEILGAASDPQRVAQEAALLAERSDVQEEVVRMKAHVEHFLGLIKTGGEAGKKLDFLLQEMNREANTMLSKTAGIAGHGLRVTELGLAMKAEIEKAREQVQNVE